MNWNVKLDFITQNQRTDHTNAVVVEWDQISAAIFVKSYDKPSQRSRLLNILH